MQKVQPFNNSNIDKTFLAEEYSCMQVWVFMAFSWKVTKMINDFYPQMMADTDLVKDPT